MKTYTLRMAGLAAAVVFTMVGPAFAGQTQAEREAAAKQGATAPELWNWEHSWALETGTLPPEFRGRNDASARNAQEPTVEIGGRVYRLGIDMP